MSAQDKQVRITVAVDEASAAKAKRDLGEILQIVTKLAEATNKINLGFGSGGGARVGAMSATPGTSASTQVAHKVASSGGGLADNLTRAVQSSAMLFKGAADGSQKSFDVMSKALKRHVDESAREVQRLIREFKLLENEMEKLQGMGPGVPKGTMANAEADYYGKAKALNQARTQHAELLAAQGAFPGSDGKTGFFGKGGTFSTIASKVQGALNASGLGFLAGASVPAVIGGTASFLSQNYQAYKIGADTQLMERPMMYGQIGARIGQAYGGAAEDIRGGNIARVLAMQSLAKDPQAMSVIGDAYKRAMTDQIKRANPTDLVGSFTKDGFGGVGKHIAQGTGRGMAGIVAGAKAASSMSTSAGPGGFAGSLPGFNGFTYRAPDAGPPQGVIDAFNGAKTASTQQEYDYEKAIAWARVNMPEKYNELVAAKIAETPRLSNAMNRIWGGAGGTVAMADASRTSGRYYQDKKTGEWHNTTQDFMTRAMEHGWDPGAKAGVMGGLSDVLGRGASGRFAETVLSLQAGGLSSGAGILAAGGQYGNATGLLGAFQHRIGGARGLDIGAGSAIGNLVSGAMMSGSFQGGGGTGLASTLLDATYGGGGFADMLGARQVQGGFGAMERVASGSIDPLQKALNAAAALKVAGGSPYATHHALMGMDTATQLEIIKSGKVGGVLAGNGVTADLVRKYVAEQDRSAFARVTPSMLTTKQAAELEKYKQHGGLFKGANIDLLAGVLSLGTGDSVNDALGRLRIQMSSRGFGTKRPVGSGAGRSSSAKSLTRQAMAAAGGVGADQAKYEGEQQDVLAGGIQAARKTAGDLDDAGEKALSAHHGSGTPEAAIDTLQQAMMGVVNALRREFKQTNRAGAPQGSAR